MLLLTRKRPIFKSGQSKSAYPGVAFTCVISDPEPPERLNHERD